MALDAVPTSATNNAYCDVAWADTYHAGRLSNDNYRCATTADKESAIIWATRLLDGLKWIGIRTVATQQLSWPRQGILYEDRLNVGFSSPYYLSSVFSSVFLDPTVNPKYIKDATAELAFWLLGGDTTAPAGTEGFSKIKIDTIELTVTPYDRQKWLNDAVMGMIYRFLQNNSNGLSVHKVST